jgi:hypothetical protein
LNGLVLNSRISQRSIIDDPVISGFAKETEQSQPGPEELAQSKKAYQQKLLAELFDFTTLARNLGYCIKVVNEHQESILGKPEEKLEEALSCIRTDLIEVAERFRVQLDRLSDGEIDAESNNPLQERVKKAAEFFSSRLEASLDGILKGNLVETDNKAVRKSFADALDRLRKESSTKLACLNAARSGFRISEYLDAKAKSAIEIPAARSHSAKTIGDTSGTILHPDLLRRLKEWRNTKAGELHLPHYMILPHKTMVTLANIVPQSMSFLKMIKGMGKKKSDKFGEELLDIIVSYCAEEKIEPSAEPVIVEKRPKKVKEETKKISFDLFKEGKSILEIAEERNLSPTTIEAHLAYFVGMGEIPVNEFVSLEMTDLIAGHFDGNEDLRLGPVKEILGEKVSWSELRFVANHIKWLRSAEHKE